MPLVGIALNILVYGAGVIGTVYAAHLISGGHAVTILARGQRLADIRQFGLVTEDIRSGARTTVAVDTIERLDRDDPYDLVLISVRRDQLASVMPELVASRKTSILLFMLNNPIGSAELIQRLGMRVMLGFAGVGGTRQGHLVSYAMIAQQPTTLGEPDGKRTDRLRTVAKGFRASGLGTQTTRDMDGWLKAHAFFVTAISGAIYLTHGDTHQLSQNNADLLLMAKGVREGFAAVRALGHAVSPFGLRVLFTWLPSAFAVNYWRRFFATEMADYIFGRHARAAANEMREVANDCRTMLKMTGRDAVALRQLYAAIDDYSDNQPS